MSFRGSLKTWAVRILVPAVVIALSTGFYIYREELGGSATIAAWVSGIGALAAAGVAVWIALWQVQKQFEREKAKDATTAQVVAGLLEVPIRHVGRQASQKADGIEAMWAAEYSIENILHPPPEDRIQTFALDLHDTAYLALPYLPAFGPLLGSSIANFFSSVAIYNRVLADTDKLSQEIVESTADLLRDIEARAGELANSLAHIIREARYGTH